MVGLLPFVLLEVFLRLFNFANPAALRDPLSGFNSRTRLFERQGEVYCTALARQPFFAPQEFPAHKSPTEFRIFCFGGSTVYGHPFEGATAFPKWLEIELAAICPGEIFRVINCGGVSYASYRLEPLVREVLHYEPDLIIVADGHNEFLEDRTFHAIKSRPSLFARLQDAAYSLRVVTLARGWVGGGKASPMSAAELAGANAQLDPQVRTRLDNLSGYASYHRDPEWHGRVAQQFEESTRVMVAACKAAHVPILIIKLGSNLRDCPPFKSEHRAGLAPEAEQAWQAAFDAATSAATTNLSTALELYGRAQAVDDEYALLDYRIARVLDRQGRTNEALRHYLLARDKDICPLRLSRPLEKKLDRIVLETRTPMLDAAGLLADQAPDGIPGFDLYLDHVHPTIGGHQLIASRTAEMIRQLGLVNPFRVWGNSDQRRLAYSNHLASLGPAYLANGQHRVEWLENWARRERLQQETTPQDAAGYVRLGIRQAELGDSIGAKAAFDTARKLDPAIEGRLKAAAERMRAEGLPAVGAPVSERAH